MNYYKKSIIICIVMALFIFATGCKQGIVSKFETSNSNNTSRITATSKTVSSQSGSISNEVSQKTSTIKNVDKNIVEMSTEKPIYPLDTQEINLIFTNNTPKDATYGKIFKMEILKDSQWNIVKFKSHTAFDAIGIILKSGATQIEKISLNIFEKNLEKGKYRISEDIFSDGTKTVSAEFEIQ